MSGMLLEGCSAAAYHRDECGTPLPSLSSSLAKVLVEDSPRHAWHLHPRLGGQHAETSNSMLEGSAAHALLFGEEDRLVVVKADAWNTKLAKMARDEALAAGKIPILQHKRDALDGLVEAADVAFSECEDIRGITTARCFDEDGDAEQTLVWKEGDAYCRARLDWISKDRKLIVDAKFTKTSANPVSFQWQLFSMRYELQAAFYRRAVQVCFGIEDPLFVFVVVEMEPPHGASIIGLAPSALSFGEEQRQNALATWTECMATGTWPGYGTKRIAYVDVPAYLRANMIERLSLKDWMEETP